MFAGLESDFVGNEHHGMRGEGQRNEAIGIPDDQGLLNNGGIKKLVNSCSRRVSMASRRWQYPSL